MLLTIVFTTQKHLWVSSAFVGAPLRPPPAICYQHSPLQQQASLLTALTAPRPGPASPSPSSSTRPQRPGGSPVDAQQRGEHAGCAADGALVCREAALTLSSLSVRRSSISDMVCVSMDSWSTMCWRATCCDARGGPRWRRRASARWGCGDAERKATGEGRLLSAPRCPRWTARQTRRRALAPGRGAGRRERAPA